jgi:probable HAF family extracellular repeat protein
MRLILISITVLGLFAAFASAQPGIHPRLYTVTDLGTLPGGTYTYGNWIANHDEIAGNVVLANGTLHAVLWRNGMISDIGTPGLEGQNSVSYAINDRSQVSGLAETTTLDPYGEDFCGFGTHLVCRGFLWQDGAMSELPTLGGANGEGLGINNRGEVAGYAENTVVDPTCPGPQLFQFKPVTWAKGEARELPTYPGDPEGIAIGINDNGAAVGASGTCLAYGVNNTGAYLLPAHALLWQGGTMTDLGNLGGSGAYQGNIGFSVNSRGDVIGNSDLPGDTTTHAFLWTKKTGMQDLGTLPGDTVSFGEDINDAGEIVGISLAYFFAPTAAHAVIWENGVPINLNSLIVPGDSAGLYLGAALAINARGEIVGWGLTSTGEVHAMLAAPVDSADDDILAAAPDGKVAVLPDDARKLLQRFGRFGGRLTGQPR